MSPPHKTPTVRGRTDFDSENRLAALEEVGVREPARVAWIRLLWERRRRLWQVTATGFVLALLTAILLPPRFESKTRLMPPEQAGSGLAALAAIAGKGGGSGSAIGGLSALGGGLASDLLGLKSSGALVVDMLGGPTIQDDLIQKFDLRKVYRDRYWEDVRRDLAKRTDIKEDRKSGVITIAVSDRDPRRAQQLAQAYVDALNALMARVSTSSARRERIFLEDRLKTVKQNLDAASQEFSQYSSKNGTLDLPSQAKATLESEATLDGQLIAAESELEGLRQIYTDSNIRVKTLTARVATLKHQVENMAGNKADLASNNSQVDGDLPSIRKLPLVGLRWANLYRDTKIQETVFELLTQEYEFAKVQEAKEIPTINVLDAALVPERKAFPPRILITLTGTLFAFCLAASLVIGSEAWKQNQSPEKRLATQIWTQIATRESKTRLVAHQFWSRLNGRNGSSRKTA